MTRDFTSHSAEDTVALGRQMAALLRNARVVLLRRDLGAEVEFITVMFFDSLDAIKAVAGPDYETSIIPEERRKYLSRHDAKAAHYEIASVHGLGGILG